MTLLTALLALWSMPLPPAVAAAATAAATGTGAHAAASDSVLVTATKFDSKNAPARLFYFRNSEVVIMQTSGSGSASSVWRSDNEGRAWARVDAFGSTDLRSSLLSLHPFAKDSTAILTTATSKHFITQDKAATWRSFEFNEPDSAIIPGSLAFHATKPDSIIFRARKCTGSGSRRACHEDSYYTTDSFKQIKLLLPWSSSCVWVQNADVTNTNLASTIVCTEWPESLQSGNADKKDPSGLQLVRSNTFFAKGDKTVISPSVPLVGVAPDWLLSIGISESSKSLQLYTSKDGSHFVNAKFHNSAFDSQQGYTVLESSNASLFVDVLSEDPRSAIPPAFGTLFKSDSDGTYFVKSLEYTNRDLARNTVDFERVQSPIFDGILLANTVLNWREIADRTESTKKLTSAISFDNGGRWSPLTPPTADIDGKPFSCTPAAGSAHRSPRVPLHLHSVTASKNIGHVFSTLSAPGILVGVGNVGPFLNNYDACDTFLSDDAGATWKMAMRGPAKFEILDMGALITLVPDAARTSKILYSWNRGKSWETLPITIDKGPASWTPLFTLLDPDSTSQRMLLVVGESGQYGPTYIIQLDFQNLHKRKCEMDVNAPDRSKDFELWKPSVSNGCVMGQSVGYYRVKPDADCSVGEKFKNPKSVVTPCACSEADYECDIGFEPDTSKSSTSLVCKPSGVLSDQPLGCKPGDTYKGRSGYRKIPGNLCKGGDESRSNPVDRTCEKLDSGPVVEPPAENQPIVKLTLFDNRIERFTYVPNSSVMFALSSNSQAWYSADEGTSWSLWPAATKLNKPVVRIGLHESIANRAFVFTDDSIYVASNIQDSTSPPDLARIATPADYNSFGIKILDFHPDKPDWYVFVAGGRECPDINKCFATTYITKDAGKTFTSIDTWSTKCLWARDFGFEDKGLPEDSVVCASFAYKKGSQPQSDLMQLPPGRRNNPANLVLISDGGKTVHTLIDKDVIDFYVIDGVMVVAVADKDGIPKLVVSTNGQSFVDAKYPPNVDLSKDRFTILESTTGGVFMDIAQGTQTYGTLLKSNENGAFFSKILDRIHHGDRSRVDFEKIQGIPGIILANVDARPRASEPADAPARVETLMSFDDGSTWTSLFAPELDSQGAKISCGLSALAKRDRCRLQLHGFSAVSSYSGLPLQRSTIGSAGLILAVGNAGDSLLGYNLGNVFLSRDAGRTWIEVAKDAHKWAIADYGGLIVLVNDEKPVDTFLYSWDFGATWAEHKFSDRLVRIEDVSTRASADSRKVIITGHYTSSSLSSRGELSLAVVSVNFEKLLSRKCDLQKDFDVWYPGSSPTSSDQRCFFGEEVSYRRRKHDSVCYVGAGFDHIIAERKQCECTAADYECDYNFFRNDAGSCSLYGVDPDQPKNCAKGTKYLGSSGFRKISLSRCKGGLDLAAKKERECGDPASGGGVPAGQVFMASTTFTSQVVDFFYFLKTATVMVLDAQRQVHVSRDQGKTWKRVDIPEDVRVTSMLEDPSFPHRAFLITEGLKLFYTDDSAASFKSVSVPVAAYSSLLYESIVPHPLHDNMLLFLGVSATDCPTPSAANCHTQAHVSFDSGRSWSQFASYVQSCRWTSSNSDFKTAFDRGVICSIYDPASGNQRLLKTMKLVRFEDAGRSSSKLSLFDTTGFAISGEYLFAAVPTAESKQVQIRVTRNAERWAIASLPKDLIVHSGYTLLSSETGSAFVHVIQSTEDAREYGTLIKSNRNGTFFKEILAGLNQDRVGYVDFEKVQGLDGRMIANVVSNLDQLGHGAAKKLQTRISLDDGSTWNLIPAPKFDSARKAYNCEPNCYLHLHAYTKRHDRRDQYSSSGSIGFLMGVGNVGESLRDFNDCDTFISRDGGRTWTEVIKDAHMYEFGDHGGIVLMVNDEDYTDTIKFTLNGGESIHEIKFTEKVGGRVRVTNILSEPSGTTSYFIVLGNLRTSDSSVVQSVAIHLDFSNVWPRKCDNLPADPIKSDYEGWNPGLNAGIGSSGCIFGVNTTYFRRKSERDCFVGQAYQDLKTVITPCNCDLVDFECAEGYHSDGNQCVPDPDTLLRGETCGTAGIHQGYIQRKISKCINGNLVLPPTSHCAVGSVSSGSWTWSILISLAILGSIIAAFIHYWNGGFGRDGQLRLPLDSDVARQNASGSDFGASLGRAVRAGGLLALDGIMFVSLVGYRAFDWVRERLTRSRGYAPLRTTVAGNSRFSFEDATRTGYRDYQRGGGMDDAEVVGLDWNDDEQDNEPDNEHQDATSVGASAGGVRPSGEFSAFQSGPTPLVPVASQPSRQSRDLHSAFGSWQ